nr:DpnI domain-containing protein [uncultured Brumimicrobium sp.]
MNLKLDLSLAKQYKSKSQISRVLTENWLKVNSYCPNCNEPYLSEFENNRPVADFYCKKCNEEYELKSKNGHKIGGQIVDGAYDTMIERINSDTNPSFFFLTYDNKSWMVNNLIIIPKHFFVTDIIIKRKPLSLKAKRAGWTGCNINLERIPQNGRIFLVKNSETISSDCVREKWNKTTFLKSKRKESRGWVLDVLNCLDRIDSNNFSLSDVYKFENELKIKYPDNNFIKDKIRQQLQVLRDRNIIEFKSRGNYKKINDL